MSLIDFIFPKECLECKKPGKYICQNCIKKVRSGGWVTRNTYSIFRYQGVVRKAIIALKYKYSTEIAKELAEICVKRLYVTCFLPKATLVPIPLHWYRQNFRGFNQSGEVGKLIASKMGWGFIPDFLLKNKSTKSQVELKGLDRRRNLENAFSLNSKHQLLDTNYVVFDDVLTTGSTLNEASRILKGSAISKVFCLTIAR